MKRFRDHRRPATAAGRRALGGFFFFLALAQPPVLLLANRIEPRIAGLPFLYAWLLAAYVGMMAVLIVAWRRGL